MNWRDLNDVSDASCLFIRVLIGSSPSAPQCLTCGLRKDRCQYSSAYFSFDASYYRLDCYGQLNIHILGNDSFTVHVWGYLWHGEQMWTIIWAQISKVIQKNWCAINCLCIFYFYVYQDLGCPSTHSWTTGAQVKVCILTNPKPIVQIFIAVVLFYSLFILSSYLYNVHRWFIIIYIILFSWNNSYFTYSQQ